MRWEYLVCGYYNDKAKSPKEPGKLALEVGVNGDSALSLEVSIFSQREDIGRIMIIRQQR